MITLATAVRNDSKGLWFTLHSALMNVQGTELAGKLKFSIVNNSEDIQERLLIRDIAQMFNSITSYEETDIYSNHYGRNLAVKLSTTEYTVLVDSHVLFGHNFFKEYYDILRVCPTIGLIHSPFTCGGVPTYRSNCFYNLQKFDRNLHGSFSHRGCSSTENYPVALAPHAGYGFRTKQWLDYGGYVAECLGNGGGEPFVSYKYWMFGSSIYLTPRTGFVHYTGVGYKRSRSNWRRNHVITAAALGGYEIGLKYSIRLGMNNEYETLWAAAEPYWKVVDSRAVIKFENLLSHFKTVQARPFI